uniref:MATH domain-containing protein n=1 Tax=Globodera rostochiensis TaxID=31243 RepID=A0A914HA21_GLORO
MIRINATCGNTKTPLMMTSHSGETSPGGSNSLSNASLRTRTTGEENQASPHKSFNLDCYNSSPERDDESDQCDEDALSQLMLHSELFRQRSSIGVQTDYNEEFPPLKFLRALGEDPTMMMGHPPFLFNAGGAVSEVPSSLQQTHQLSIPSLSATVPTTTASAAMSVNAADATSSTSSDGMLQLVIQNFRHMSDTVRGPCKYIQGVPWRIMVMPRQHVVQKKGTQKCLGFFLQCCPDAYSESWSCQASAELRLISQKPGVPNFTRKTNHVYTAKENDWGYSCFMTWADILDEAQGYIKEDKVTLEVSVKADPPRNILTHKEFQKKIQDYKRLADLQCHRGLIDKAIECNTQALKFCKDKDPQCKTELEAQKAHLIEMKLKQSIQRIEKGGDGGKIEDDSATNLNALRQALGTTTRSNNSKTTKNKSTSTKDKETVTTGNNNVSNNNGTGVDRQQQNQRAGTPPYTTQQKSTIDQQSDQPLLKPTKNSRPIEPQIQKTSLVSTSTTGTTANNSSASSTEMLCAADDFDFMKDRYIEEEVLLPNQIKHFLCHLSEGGKSPSRLKDQIAKLEMIASPFEKHDPFLEELMKIDPKEADNALVKALAFTSIERESDREKCLSKVIRNKICESCLKEGHFQIEKRETSESGCQTEFARRVPAEVHADDATFRMMQQIQQQQHLVGHGQPTAEDYMNVLNNQAAFAAAAAAQQQQNQMHASINVSTLPPARRKKAAAKKSVQQHQQTFTAQHQQNILQQQLPQFMPKVASGRLQTDASQAMNAIGGLDLSDPRMEIFAAAAKPFIGTPGIVENLSALADLDLSKLQFPTETNSTDPNQGANIFSRQYIEEWFRYSARNVLKLNYDHAGDNKAAGTAAANYSVIETQQQQLYAATASSGTTEQEMQFNEAAALGVIQLNCLNARTIQQKVAEFVETLESHPNFRDLRTSIERLLSLSADDENFTNPEDTVSVVSVSEISGRDVELNREPPSHDFSNIQRLFLEDDPHDYMLLKELKQTEMVLATRLNSIMYQMHQASIADIVDRIELKTKTLEDKLKASKSEHLKMTTNEKKSAEQLSQLHKDLQTLNGKYEKLIQQLKERKNEIKKLEKKAKSEAQLATENNELHEKMDTMKKELAQVQRQLSDEQAKYKRDTQSLADSKKHLSIELNGRYAEVQKLTTQLEEKAQTLKKSEQQLANERKNSSQTISNLQERVKRSEVNLLEHKLDDGLRVLERAKDDCSQQIKLLEEQRQKRKSSSSDLEVIKKNIGEWENKREEVTALIVQAKNDFTGHIQSIKNGKQLSQLPKIQPVPSSSLVNQQQPSNGAIQQPMPPSPLPLDRKVITPPGRSHISASAPQQHGHPGAALGQHPNITATAQTGRQSIPSSANVTPVKFQTQPPGHLASIAPIGVRPQNYQNGISVPLASSSSTTMQQQKMSGCQRHSPQLSGASMMGGTQFHATAPPPPIQQFHVVGHPLPPVGQPSVPLQQQQTNAGGSGVAGSGSFQTWGGGWGDQLNNISELFGQGRSFGPLGSEFGGSGGNVIDGMRSASVIHPPAAGVIGAPSSTASVGNNSNNAPSSQPIGAGRNLLNVSPSQQQQRNGWPSFVADSWNMPLSGRQN